MKNLTLVLAVLVVVLGGAMAAGVAMIVRSGVSAREEPMAIEAFFARRLRHLAIPAEARALPNPLPASDEIVAEGREHFADHCALCHANDGSGQTEIGENLYPKAPDMAKDNTQSLSDGELFWIIRNGIRFTGMPAWGSGDPADDHDSWELVHFIRRLPKITKEELREMEALNPKSPHEEGEGKGEGEHRSHGGNAHEHGQHHH